MIKSSDLAKVPLFANVEEPSASASPAAPQTSAPPRRMDHPRRRRAALLRPPRRHPRVRQEHRRPVPQARRDQRRRLLRRSPHLPRHRQRRLRPCRHSLPPRPHRAPAAPGARPRLPRRRRDGLPDHDLSRIATAQQIARDTPSSRVIITGSLYNTRCRAIRRFLSANRVQYDWTPNYLDPAPQGDDDSEITIAVDGREPLINPTVRQVAEALGYRTVPRHDHYDVIIAGAGPAGMAAAVYGASEGLRVLIVERYSPGGQAGTSSRIENYLGFPSGISGDELTERALKQAKYFGAEIIVKRDIEAILETDLGHCVRLDGGDLLVARAVLIATGVDWHRMEVPGMDTLMGRGILYGASRHEAYAVTGKRVFLVGGGNSAGQAAVYFSSYAKEIVLLVRGPGLTHSMSQYLIDQIADKRNIRVEPYTELTSVHGENYIEADHHHHHASPTPNQPPRPATPAHSSS